MIYILENFGIWAPGIITILGGAVFAFWTVPLSHSEQGEEEKAGLKEIK